MNEITVEPVRLLLVEDDEADILLSQRAFERANIWNKVDVVRDGREALDYLHNEGAYADQSKYPRPDLILLDLNMPRKDGREALREIKADPLLRAIPVVVLTTSSADEDILRSYDLGVNSYVEKPVTFPKLVELITELGNYWFKIVKLPPNDE